MFFLIRTSFFSFFLFSILFSCGEVSFSKADFADWTLPENQDSISATVTITRGDSQSIFNITQEESYSGSNDSPMGTLWAKSATADAAPEDYVSFNSMHSSGGGGGNSGPQSLIGETVSMYIPAENLYFDIQITAYTGGQTGGGFAWTRTCVEMGDDDLSNEMLAPSSFNLNSYPNPFNPSTTISITLDQMMELNLDIYNLNGHLVESLYSGYLNEGTHRMSWEPKLNPAGVYLARAISGSDIQTTKLIYIK